MTNQNINSTIILSHPTERKVLSLKSDETWGLPTVAGGPTNDEMVGPLQMAVKEQLGLDVAIGRQLFKKKEDESIEYIYDALLLQPGNQDSKVQWFGKESVEQISLSNEEYRTVLEKWISEEEVPTERAQWFKESNFYDCIASWVRSEVEKEGLAVIGNLEQVKASDFCLIQRVPTNTGDLYFKATGPAARHEAALSKYMDGAYPGKSVAVVATNDSEGWLLMRDVEGEALRSLKDKELWKRAIREYAELQIAELGNVDKLLSIGVPDRRMPALKEEISLHLADMCATGLSDEETKQMIELLPEILEMCDELDAILPASIEHGDLHTNNIRLVRGDLVVFDWGDAAVSHPFFSSRIFWHALDDLIEDWSEPEWLKMVDEFRPYYLEPWTKFAPMEKLERALRISDELACIQRALSWYLYLTPSREDKAESFKRPSQWLQLFLEHRALVVDNHEKADSIFTICKAVTDKDYHDCSFITNTLNNSYGVNAEGLKHDFANSDENLLVIGRVNGQPAGSLVCKPSSAPQQMYTMIRVLPEYRKQGLGDMLYKAASEYAQSFGRVSLQGRITETDADALAFFAKRGFEEVARECMVSLYTADIVQQQAEMPEGIEIYSLDQRTDLWEGAYKVACEGIPDIPAPEPLNVEPFDKWVQSEIKAPGVRLDGSFVAVAEGQVIGYAGMEQISDTVCEHLLTAVVRDWRGKGIAKLLKKAQIHWAIQSGIEELVTYNDKDNDPIRRLNAGLGYKPQPINFIMRGPVYQKT